MSAFMVSSQTINSLAYKMLDQKDVLCVPCDKRFDNPYKTLLRFKSWEELSDALHLMNLEAIRQKYGQEYTEEVAEYVDFDAKPKKLSSAQFCKSINCLLYQCSEGDVSDSQLYKELDQFSDGLPMEIMLGSKAYDKAKWG
jgi:hypothetical protein